MNISLFLALHVHPDGKHVDQAPTWLQMQLPAHWPHQTDLLTWCQGMSPGLAAFLVIAGIIYLLFGVYMYKFLVTLNGAIFGAIVGALIGEQCGSWEAGAMLGGFTAAATTFPLMKYAVAVMGGVYGALLGGAIWRTFPLPPTLWGAGALCGLITFGMLSFVLFRGSVMMYTSLQGSVMLILGLLGLIFKYDEIAPNLHQTMMAKHFILPMSIFIPTIIGLIYQQTQFAKPAQAGPPKK